MYLTLVDLLMFISVLIAFADLIISIFNLRDK